MAGYNYKKLMSNRGLEDLKKGIVPKWMVNIPHQILVKYFFPQTFHHTGVDFKNTAFYNREQVLAYFGVVQSEKYPVNPMAAAELEQYKKEKEAGKAAKNPIVIATPPVRKKPLTRSELHSFLGFKRKRVKRSNGKSCYPICNCEACTFNMFDKVIASWRFYQVSVPQINSDEKLVLTGKRGLSVELCESGHCIVHATDTYVCLLEQVEVGLQVVVDSLGRYVDRDKREIPLRNLKSLLDEGVLSSSDGLIAVAKPVVEVVEKVATPVEPAKPRKPRLRQVWLFDENGKSRCHVYACGCSSCNTHTESVVAFMRFDKVSLPMHNSDERYVVEASKKSIKVELLESGHCVVHVGQKYVCMPEQVEVGKLFAPGETRGEVSTELTNLKSMIDMGLPDFTASEYSIVKAPAKKKKPPVAPVEVKEPPKLRFMCGCESHSDGFEYNSTEAFKTDRVVLYEPSGNKLEYESKKSNIFIQLLADGHCSVQAKDLFICKLDQVEVGNLKPKEKDAPLDINS